MSCHFSRAVEQKVSQDIWYNNEIINLRLEGNNLAEKYVLCQIANNITGVEKNCRYTIIHIVANACVQDRAKTNG